jgi:hypothetical protein
MMSKERELLGRWHNGDLLPEEYMKLMKDTKELLTQPEGITPRQGLEEYKKGYAQAELDLKREPLSDLDVFTLYEEAEYIGFLAYRKGIKDAEKAHGITGGGE